jgi:hypothetical protein
MNEHTDRRRMAAPARTALTSLLVAAGIGVVGVVPALAASDPPAPKAFERAHQHGPYRWFRDRGDVRYVWFRVCDGTATGAATSTTPTPTTTAETTTEAVATDALAAAVEGASAETATTTVTSETTTSDATTADDDSDDETYPTFVVVPMPKDEAAVLRKLDDRPCYDLTTGAPQTTATTTTADTTTDTATATDTTTTTTPAAAAGITG